MSTPSLTPVPADQAVERYFLEARSKILDLAAILDRIGRGQGAAHAADDPRMARMRQALEILLDPSGGRAERVQQVFSIAYEPGWLKAHSAGS